MAYDIFSFCFIGVLRLNIFGRILKLKSIAVVITRHGLEIIVKGVLEVGWNVLLSSLTV